MTSVEREALRQQLIRHERLNVRPARTFNNGIDTCWADAKFSG